MLMSNLRFLFRTANKNKLELEVKLIPKLIITCLAKVYLMRTGSSFRITSTRWQRKVRLVRCLTFTRHSRYSSLSRTMMSSKIKRRKSKTKLRTYQMTGFLTQRTSKEMTSRCTSPTSTTRQVSQRYPRGQGREP